MEHLEPQDAHAFLEQNPDAVFIDCRSEMEYLFVGHPVGALHVAWNDGPDWDVNPHFVGQVKKLAGTNHTTRSIVLICRSGNRSQEAGEELERHGFATWARSYPSRRMPIADAAESKRLAMLCADLKEETSLAREGYRKTDFNAHDLWDALTFPGLWRFLNRHKRMCWEELRRSFSRS